MLKRIIAVLLVLILSVAILSGCSSAGKKGRNDILGTWTVSKFEEQNASNVILSLQAGLLGMLFSPGNTIEFINHNKVTIMMNSMEYQWLDKNKIQLGSDEGGDAPIAFDVEINKDIMIFTSSVANITFVKGEKLPDNLIESDKSSEESNIFTNDEMNDLINNNDQLREENDQLKEEKQRLQEENERYKSVVDARELITVDHDIDEKFSNAYGIDENPIVYGMEFSINSVGEGTEFNGRIVEQGSLVYIDFKYNNNSIEDLYLSAFTMTLVEKDGTTYQPHFQRKDGIARNDKLLSDKKYLFNINGEDFLAPRFSDEGSVVFNVPSLSDSYLLQVEYGVQDVAYIRIK